MGIISMAKQNMASGGLRLARIQYKSALKPEGIYFSHRYDIRVKRQHLYSQGGLTDSFCRLYCSPSGIIAEISDTAFYIYDSGTYVDLCINMADGFSRINVDIETSEPGSVSMKLDAYSLTGLPRLTVINPTLTSMFNKIFGKTYSYYQDFSINNIIKLNNTDTFMIMIGTDIAVISANGIVKAPTSWTLTKGADISVNGEVIGSNYTIGTTASFRGTVVMY